MAIRLPVTDKPKKLDHKDEINVKRLYIYIVILPFKNSDMVAALKPTGRAKLVLSVPKLGNILPSKRLIGSRIIYIS